eukprot:gene9351-13484_t
MWGSEGKEERKKMWKEVEGHPRSATAGACSETVPAFAAAFAATRAAGLLCAQTDAPSDAVALVKAWAKDANIDVLSPQLYSTGREAAPEFAETNSCKDAGCTWSLYAGALPAFAPSIVDASQYPAVESWFASAGITARGYFEWRQR